MTHTSGASSVIDVVLTITLWAFFFWQTWHFDRWRCLRLDVRTGRFLRAMTYSYLLGIPFFLVWPLTQAVIKYNEGFIELSPGHWVPTPYQLWRPEFRRAITPIYWCLAASGAFEALTHWEELLFWIFLLHTADRPTRRWVDSWECRIWLVVTFFWAAAFFAVMGAAQNDPLRMGGNFFIVSVIQQAACNLVFQYVVARFPALIATTRALGGAPEVVVRLFWFHELNKVRLVFRWLYVFSMGILAFEGTFAPHAHVAVNESMFATDLLSNVAVVGFAVSSAITVLVFFPRSIEIEMGFIIAERAPNSTRARNGSSYSIPTAAVAERPQRPDPPDSGTVTSGNSPPQLHVTPPDVAAFDIPHENGTTDEGLPTSPSSARRADSMTAIWPDERGRRRDVELAEMGRPSAFRLRRGGRGAVVEPSGLHPMLRSYVTPLDVDQSLDDDDPIGAEVYAAQSHLENHRS